MVDRDIWAVIPIKSFASAKTRLSPALAASARRALAQAMAQDVLSELASVSRLSGVIVVSQDAQAARLARRYGAVVWTAGADLGHSGAVMAAASRLAREGRDGMLTVPGDVPCITADEVEALLAAHRPKPAFTIAPAHDRRGSNAILMSPPDAIPLAFGDDSLLPHLATAREARIEPVIVPLAGLGLDIDNPADLEALSRATPGVHTCACLDRFRQRGSEMPTVVEQ